MGYTAALMGACGLLLGRASDYFERIGLSAFDGFGRALSSDALSDEPGQALLFASPVLLGAGLLVGAVLLGMLKRWDWPVLAVALSAVVVIVVVGLVDEALHQIEGRYYAKSRYVADVMGVARPVQIASYPPAS